MTMYVPVIIVMIVRMKMMVMFNGLPINKHVEAAGHGQSRPPHPNQRPILRNRSQAPNKVTSA